MPDVLRGREHSERQTVQEISIRKQALNGPQLKSGAVVKKPGDIFDLRNVVLAIAAMFHQQRERVEVLTAGMRRVQ